MPQALERRHVELRFEGGKSLLVLIVKGFKKQQRLSIKNR